MDRLLGCFCVAVLAWWFAAALNIPAWCTWIPGDRFNLALWAFLAAYFLTANRK